MSYEKFPIVWWQDKQGTVYARTISGEFVCAADVDLKKCLKQIKSAMLWQSEHSFVRAPEFDDPKLEQIKVAFRTSEASLGGRHLSSEQSWVTVPCVWGKREDGSVVCESPTLDMSFQCDSEDDFREIAREQVQAKLNGCSQAELAEMLSEGELSVDSINVKLGETKGTQWTFSCDNLETVAHALTGRFARKQFNAPINRDSEVEQLHRRMRLEHGNILVVGPRGVGKSTIIAAAARKLHDTRREIAKEKKESEIDVAKSKTPSVWMCSADRIVAGMRYLGEWEQRMESVIEELSEFQGILCFERLDSLCRLGGQDASASIASFLAPFIQNRELRVVIEATREELDQCRLLLPGFENLFEIFEVEPMPENRAQQLLDSLGKEYTRNHKIEYKLEAATLCQRLFKRFMPYDTFPGKCVGFWKGLFEATRRSPTKGQIDQDRVVSAFVELTGLPESLIRDKVSLPANEIREWFEQRIIGQPDPCKCLTDVIATFKAGLNDPGRPIGVMLFCGPTGVGKTETVKALTRFMFGNAKTSSEHEKQAIVRERLVRLDMSEFSGIGAAQRLTVQSNGQPGELVKRLRQQPFSIVLLDEIEKASPEVFDVLMGVMDEGRLTDKWGRVTDFRSAIIIMTSNLGVKTKEAVGFQSDDDSGFEAGVRKFFRPEFFNRIDRVVAFGSLSIESVCEIAELELQAMSQREGFSSRRLKLEWDESVIEFLVNKGYSQKLGARPLQRTIQQEVSTRIARILATQPDLSDTSFVLSVVDGALVVETAQIA